MSPAATSLRKQILPSVDEEAASQAPSSVSDFKDAACATFKKKISSPLVAIFFLVVLAAGIAFSRDTAPANAESGAGETEQRILQPDAWEYVDEELLALSTGQDGDERTTSISNPDPRVSAPGTASEYGDGPVGGVHVGFLWNDHGLENGGWPEADSDGERVAELKRNDRAPAARAHRRTKARRRAARRMAVGGQRAVGSE